MQRSAIALCAFLLYIAPVYAQESGPADVSIESYADDMVGLSLVYEVKEEFRSSPAFNLVSREGGTLRIIISTMPRYEDNPSISTIYSVKWTLRMEGDGLPLYVNGTLGYCGRDVVESSARSIVASTDELVSDLVDALKSKQDRRGSY
jgi:hypothetical protein